MKTRRVLKGWKPKRGTLKEMLQWLTSGGSGPLPTLNLLKKVHEGPYERAKIVIDITTGDDA